MTAENKIKQFVLMSKNIGSNPAYVQGGGGNSSVKLDDRRMAVKASGGLLKNISEQSGYSVVDYAALRNYLQSPDNDENVFTKKIKSLNIETQNRPSMETGFHALLGEYVIHSHSIYANILTCSREGKQTAQKLFPHSLWVNYATPGRELTLEVQNALHSSDNSSCMIFLQNHGMIAVGKSAQDALNLHEDVNRTIQNHFDVSVDSFRLNEQDIALDFIKANILFPDQIVYILADEKIFQTLAAHETLAAYHFILTTIKQKGLTPNFLEKAQIEILLNMESEKYRQKVLKNDHCQSPHQYN